MPRTVVLIGHCSADSSYLRIAVNSADRSARTVAADDDATLQRLIADGADLLLINRVLECGFAGEDGAALIRRLRQDNPGLKMMLISNYPDAQAAAIAAGALPGFGKRELGGPRVGQLLHDALCPS
jgi:two-component system, chemotaxis family, chemotaxis protein CheY